MIRRLCSMIIVNYSPQFEILTGMFCFQGRPRHLWNLAKMAASCSIYQSRSVLLA
ncbi:hypothetical protein N182_35840 [Sinorhizobium sp. GL2]|nr:hypothetical protein N182_35840 [Sinorhizobium sp. GL2]